MNKTPRDQKQVYDRKQTVKQCESDEPINILTVPQQISKPQHPVYTEQLNSKLRYIQSNKVLIEKKIQDYER